MVRTTGEDDNNVKDDNIEDDGYDGKDKKQGRGQKQRQQKKG